MRTTFLSLLVLWQLCSRTEAILKRVVGGWIYEEISLTRDLVDEDDLLWWLRSQEIAFDVRRLELSEATLAELAHLPLVFYKEYAHRDHFKQIWPILKGEMHLSAHLQTVKEMSAFVEPGAIPNTIIRPDGSIPWRRQGGLDDFYESDRGSFPHWGRGREGRQQGDATDSETSWPDRGLVLGSDSSSE